LNFGVEDACHRVRAFTKSVAELVPASAASPIHHSPARVFCENSWAVGTPQRIGLDARATLLSPMIVILPAGRGL